MEDSPEALLALYADRIHLRREDVDCLLSLMQAARSAGSLAGAAAEREACARIADEASAKARGWRDEFDAATACGAADGIAAAIRARGGPQP